MADYIGQRLGNYELLGLLGQGGFAEVYLARHIYLKTSAAIKVLQVRLTDSALDKFLAEARTIAQFSHPHIIRVLEFGIEQGTPFLVMNYAPHGSLRQRHPASSVLSSTLILSYVQQVASALQYAHDRMIIHRDVKPENMLLGEAFVLMLSDFGLATTVQNHSVNSMPIHHTQSAAGTTTYMAPEQFDGVPSPASDQYALAVAVYEWFCGIPPFQGSTIGVAIQHIQAPPRPLREQVPSLAPSIEQVVLRALAKDPQARFPRVQDFAHALAEACIAAPTNSDHVQGRAPLVLPSVTLTPSNSLSPVDVPKAWMRDYASATVADHAFAHNEHRRHASLDQQRRHTSAPPGSRSPRPISRRRIILGLAGGASALAALSAGGVWLALSQSRMGTTTMHLKPSVSPTPNAEATAQVLVNEAKSRPSMISLGSGLLDLFVRDIANALWRRHYDGTWHAWESLGGPFPFDPVAISWDGQRIDLFMRGEDQTLQHRVYDGTWHAWESLGGSLASDPAVTSWQAGRLDVFARGAADNALWHIWFDGNWHAWESLGGSILAGPAATSWGPNRLDVFVRGADSALWHIGWDVLLWSGWESLGGSCLADPAATSWGPNRLDVFTLGSDATLQRIWFDGSTGASWRPWESLGGQLETAPTVASWGNDRIDIVARNPSNALQHIWFDGSWQQWSPLR